MSDSFGVEPEVVLADRPSFEQMAAPNGFINAAVGHCRAEDRISS